MINVPVNTVLNIVIPSVIHFLKDRVSEYQMTHNAGSVCVFA